MKIYPYILLKLLMALLFCGSVFGAPKPFLHPLFTNNMVIQRDAPAPVWGWTTPGSLVTVSLNGHSSTATADSTGRWQVSVGPFPAGGPYTLSVTGPSSVSLTNVMMGDVFLCSGQSNMEWTVNNSYNAAVEAADSVNYPHIRCFTVGKVASLTEEETLATNPLWQVAGTNTTKSFTAVGYFMAREISKQVPNVPIGILSSAWGGTQIQSWVDQASLSTFADVQKALFDGAIQVPNSSGISQLYNGLISPLAPFRIKGVVWYQGEFNSGRGEQYDRLLPLLKARWRSVFGQPNLPFIIVQLPNNDAVQSLPVETGGWAEIREAQTRSVVSDPYSALVTTIDIGEGQLHPLNKQDTGKRASKAALKLFYGQTLVHQGPIFTGATVSGSTIVCQFSNVGGGLMIGTKNAATPLSPVQQVTNGTLQGFAIAGDDKVFRFANAVISGSTVVVSSPDVSTPKWVRYAWANNPTCNLYAKITDGSGAVVDGLPAGSFRNDPTYRLSVNSGGGSGFGAFNSSLPINASTLAGQTFAGWSGDVARLANPALASTTATLGQTYVAVKANYSITAAPSGFILTPQIGGIQLTWSPMAQVHYKIERAAQSSGPFTVLTDRLLETEASYLDTAITEGTIYYYRISAFNATSPGVVSTVLNAQMTRVVHDVAAATAADQIIISWVALPAASSFSVKRSLTAGGPYTTVASGLSGTSYVDRSAGPGAPHYYVVTARISGQETPTSTEASASLPVLNTPAPATPASSVVTVTAEGSNVTLSWNSTARASAYRIRRATSSTGPFTAVADVQRCAYDCVGLTAGNTYYFTVSAVNPAGESTPSSQMTVDLAAHPTVPLPPVGVNATRGNAAVQLSWNASTTATCYKVKRAYVIGGPFSTIATVTTPSYSHSSGITNGNPLFYKISAVNAAGESPDSSQVLAFPQASPVNWALRAVNGLYVSASGTSSLIANKSAIGATEWFTKVTIDGGYIALQSVANGQIVCAESGGALPLIANRQRVGGMEKFTLIDKGLGNIGLLALTNGKYVCAEAAGSQPLIANRLSAGAYETFQVVTAANPATPVGLTASSVSGGIALSWTTPAATTGYSVKRATASAGPYSQIATPPEANYLDTSAVVGTTFYYVVAALNGAASSPLSTEVSATVSGSGLKGSPTSQSVTQSSDSASVEGSGGGPSTVGLGSGSPDSPSGNKTANQTPGTTGATNELPSPWQHADIGEVIPGIASYLNSVYSLTGSGKDIWGTADQFHYVYQTASGDCSVIARLLGVGNTHVWAKAGVMIRETTGVGSTHAAVFVTPGAGVSFQWRSITGEVCSFASRPGSAPGWVKLMRQGATFTAFHSGDGNTWTPIGNPQTIPMAGAVTIGLGVTAHDPAKSCKATIGNVIVTP